MIKRPVYPRLLETLFLQKHTGSGFVKKRLAWAQQQSEAVIAAERLHQRALEGHCSICAPPAPLRASRQTHGQQALASSLIGSCHGDAGSQR
ncbi:unnamed protein product [Pleuronectes platessa]|uniref:Uncharacterized protein n=1 Tax=Pleuronectes platessa TaxID=8262 RepID=A0A9N7Z5T8_PLEPL|nr:unnamed protein product [Pleuronectes platessa]